MYATAAARQDGLLLLCGGRSEKGQPLNDAYGLARHRDGRWEWASAPSNMPVGRYQHAAVFVGARLHVSGGSLGGGKMVDKKDSILILDSTAGVWASPLRENADDLSRRCRCAIHTSRSHTNNLCSLHCASLHRNASGTVCVDGQMWN
jgi:protein phosphatase